MADFGHLRSSAAAEQSSGEPRRRPARPNHQIRSIQNQRPGLDRCLVRSEPQDRDPTDQIRAYPFGLAFFSKETLIFCQIDPQSRLIQKYLRLGPVFNVLTPDLL